VRYPVFFTLHYLSFLVISHAHIFSL